MRRLIGLIATMTVALGSVSAAQNLGRNSDTWTWEGRIDSGKWFRLSSINGPVSIEASDDNMVHVRAEKVLGRGNTTEVAFQVIQSDGDVRVCALWRQDVCDEDGLHSSRNNGDGNRRNVHVRFTVRVPRGVRVSAGTVNGEMRVSNVTSEVRASTVNGRVEVRNVGGQVRASTVNGAVDVSTSSGPVSASTVNGSIDVSMSSMARDGDLKFSTVNGNVVVAMPSSVNADVSIGTTHGSISSDYPVQISGKWGPRRAEGTIGQGGRRLDVSTVNGSVELKKAR
ncbi:MAG: DUF4097 family beta strand repeat-containing protein [Gemmatimonadaceae bacterium]